MSTLSVVERGPPVTPREGSYPQLRNKSKIAKGCHLSSVTRLPVDSSNHSFDPNVCPVRGSSLLCVEPSREYKAPHNSPRNTIASPRSPSKVEDILPASHEVSPENDRPLSVVGERFSSLSGMASRAISRVSSYVPPSRTDTNASFYNKPANDLSEITLAYEDSEEGEPSVPPPTPSECSISSFKVDGLRIGSVCDTRCTQSNRDFNPGYVKRTNYCCDKCAERMTCHESLVLDSCSAFYPYQKCNRIDTLERSTSHFTPVSDDIHTFLESSLSYSVDDEQRRQFSRLWGNGRLVDTTKSSPSPTKLIIPSNSNTGFSSSCSKACVIEQRQDESSDSEDALDDEAELEVTVSDLDNKEPLTVIKCQQAEASNVIGHPEPTAADVERKDHIEKAPDRSKTKVVDNVQTSGTMTSEREKMSFWSPDWKLPSKLELSQEETVMVSPCASRSQHQSGLREQDVIVLPSIYVKTKPKSGVCRATVTERSSSKTALSEIDRNSNTCDGITPKLQDNLPPAVFDSAKVKQVLQECAEIIDVPKRQLLPEITMVPDNSELCYTPIVDKRYNRWKRRRRKRNKGDESGYKTVSPCESSSDENRESMINDSSVLNVKLRRRRKLPEEDDFGYQGSSSHPHDLHYDGSCELMSSDKDFNSYNFQEDVNTSVCHSNGTIEEHKERIRTVIEQRAKDTLQQEAFNLSSYSGRKEEQNVTSDLGSCLLQTSQVTITRKPSVAPTPPTRKDEEENLTKSTPKLPCFKAKKPTYARKTMPFQEDQNRYFKPIDRSLVYHAASDGGAVIKLSKSNPSGDSPSQSSSGLVRIRMDKASKERLLLSRMARHKVVTGNLLPRKRPVSEVKLPSSSSTNGAIPQLSLNHLLQTIPNHSTSKNKLVEDNDTPKKQGNITNVKESPALAPEVVGLQKKHEGSPTDTSKKELKRSPKRKCSFAKKPLLDMMNKAYFREIELKVKNRDIERVRNVSSLSFTPSFSYSLFELPEIYKKYNKDIENRVSMAWPVTTKLKQR
ncbi:uncharacterized protein LOC132556075 [Ylistrum balloti]|uniref:uncharacterized protein LOC132556075 n=1 Tax=Ylistrum balloti TaxID=509963 RepID=UPI002905A530|nr:uncharacterized protein LOC132556075 [Ylistrum balloti]